VTAPPSALLARLPDVELFMRFVELDASTEGKDPGLLRWLRSAGDGTRLTTSVLGSLSGA
jgi:hypothetical protein